MMIVIENFKMPEDCHVCPCAWWGTCRLTGKYFPESMKRHQDCPLQDDGCDICEYKYRCSKKPAGKAVIFGCKDFKKEEQ